MPPYLPIRALNRSASVRIGGSKVAGTTTSYIDLGNLPAPIAVNASTVTTGGTGLTATQAYYYKVTTLGNQGESTPSAEVTVTTGSGTTNSNSLAWSAVSGATGYNVYRSTTTGTEAFLAKVTTNAFTDTGATGTIAASTPPAANSAVATTATQLVRKELAYHSSIGQIYPVGSLTNSNSDLVVFQGLTVSGGASSVATVTAGELLLRSADSYVAVAQQTATVAPTTTTSPRYDLISVDAAGTIHYTAGTAAANPVAPATPANQIAVVIVQVPTSFTSGTTNANTCTFVDVRPRG